MKYKAIICDLDGTLLNSHHTISEFTKETIRKITAKGIKFYIATGRHHMDATIFKDMLGLRSYLISSNGARVHNDDNEEIFSLDIPKDIATEIINLTIDEDIHKSIYLGNQWISEVVLPEAQEFHRESGFIQTIIPSFEAVKNQEITKFFFISEDEEKINILHEEVDKKIGNKVNVTLSLASCLEIMNSKVSKGAAIERMLELEGIKLEEAVAFGDGLNDLEMLGTVGEGFLMGNHNPRLKQLLPTNEVIKSNDEDGVAHKLAELFL
ncbi:MAG: Cof-type HAD-IIB family hydrolase [Fusobacteriaceae bacterium]